jgi:hypothetical protein
VLYATDKIVTGIIVFVHVSDKGFIIFIASLLLDKEGECDFIDSSAVVKESIGSFTLAKEWASGFSGKMNELGATTYTQIKPMICTCFIILSSQSAGNG